MLWASAVWHHCAPMAALSNRYLPCCLNLFKSVRVYTAIYLVCEELHNVHEELQSNCGKCHCQAKFATSAD